MIILIAGSSHTGKTLLAQRLLEKYGYPYLSIDHLKMGLIRSGNTSLTPMDDDLLTDYLWPIVREMIKTAIENRQNLIVEGCYIPFNWRDDFGVEYLRQIRYRCLIMTERYIRTHFPDIRSHAGDIEQRLDDSGLDMNELIRDNRNRLEQCRKHGCPYILIDESYPDGLADFPLDHTVREASFPDMSLASHIMVTSFRTAFASFVSPETMDACTNPDNCLAMLEGIFAEGRMRFLMAGDVGFLCWQETESGAEIVALHTLPESWGTGTGHALLTEALNRIGEQKVFLWAFEKNIRARKFYEKHGFRRDGRRRVSEFDGAIEIRYSNSARHSDTSQNI